VSKCKTVEICVPTETVNDDTVIIQAWSRRSGEIVATGDIIATIETSKASFDLEAPRDGYLFYRHSAGTEVAVGAVLAVITPDADFSFESSVLNEIPIPPAGAPLSERCDTAAHDRFPLAIMTASTFGSESGGRRLSRSARRLIEQHGLDLQLFPAAGLVTETDVREVLSRQQQTDRPQIDQRAGFEAAGQGGACGNATLTGGGVTITGGSQQLLVLGGGGHAKICIDIIKQMKMFELAGIIDENLEPGVRVLDIPVIGWNEDLQKLFDQGVRLAVNGVGATSNPRLRQKLYTTLKTIGFQLPNLIHPRAVLEPSVRLGEGNQIMAGAIVGADAVIGDNCIVNAGAIVSHDCRLEDNAHLAPGAILAGGVTVGRNTLVGMGATVYLQVRIGRDAVIHNGRNISRDVPDGAVVRS
jgi:sugar O-acyltransferase (sialic acid O-acetyltransferase NeuD family)